jgi:SAM-dependent methyltransferase
MISYKPTLSKSLDLGMDIRSEPQNDLENLLSHHRQLFQDRVVLDLACYTGVSSNYAKQCDAKFVIGVDYDETALAIAKENFSGDRIEFLCQDVEDSCLTQSLVNLSQIVMSFGALYHFTDPHKLLKTLAQPHIEYLLLDTLYGPETSTPDVYCRFEKQIKSAGLMEQIIPKYAHNLPWFMEQLDILGFGMDRVEKYYTTTDFSKVKDLYANMRMSMRFFNRKKFPDKKSFTIDEVWEWSADNLIQEIQ